MRIQAGAVAAVILLAFSAQTAEAQRNHHDGIWVGFGLGAGFNVSEGLDGTTETGGSGYIRIGGTLRENLLLGVESLGWSQEKSNKFLYRGNTTLALFFYPSQSAGFFAKAGVGFARVEFLEPFEDRLSKKSKNGVGVTVGAGYDIRLGDNVSLTPAVDWLFQGFDATSNGTTTNNIIAATVGITIH